MQKVSKIKILCGPAHVNHNMRRDFERFKKEMDEKGLPVALRVLTNKSLLQEIHDRWILSETTSWNVPPLNSIFQNQAAEIHRSKGAIPFEDWWKQGKDILEEWNTIQSVL